jgi:thioredoxin-like negative regulator of GroEL
LGHLLDVALGRPNDAVPLLAEAYKREPKESEIAASYAHALARAGKLALAKKVLRKVVAKGATAEQMILWRWLEQGAPPPKSAAKGGPTSTPPRPKSRKRPRPAQAPARRS